jgi:hypothetical protein
VGTVVGTRVTDVVDVEVVDVEVVDVEAEVVVVEDCVVVTAESAGLSDAAMA